MNGWSDRWVDGRMVGSNNSQKRFLKLIVKGKITYLLNLSANVDL